MGIERYVEPKVFAAARSEPAFNADEPGLHWLRLVVNCIKHGNGDIYDLSPDMFDATLLAAADDGEPGYRTALRLGDENVEKAFAAVRASGPGRSGADTP